MSRLNRNLKWWGECLRPFENEFTGNGNVVWVGRDEVPHPLDPAVCDTCRSQPWHSPVPTLSSLATNTECTSPGTDTGSQRVWFWKRLFLTSHLKTQLINSSVKKYNRTKIVETRQRGIRMAMPGTRCRRSCSAGDTFGKCFFSIVVL